MMEVTQRAVDFLGSELVNGGGCVCVCFAGLHFKSHETGIQNCQLSYKLQPCSFIIGAPASGPLLWLPSQLSPLPAASQAGTQHKSG